MFVRTLVSGVRSSCDASATSWRWARVDSSSAPSIVLKLAREPAELVAPVDLDPLGEVPRLGDALGVSVSFANGRERGARDDEPEPGRDDDATGGDQEQEEPDAARATRRPRSAAVRPGLPRPGPYANVKTRRCVPSTSSPPEGGASLARDREHVVVDRELDVLPRRREHGPSCVRAGRIRAPRRTPGGRRGTTHRPGRE